MWRWDQGRLQYFQFDSLKQIAKTLIPFDGIDIGPRENSLLREALVQSTGLPFKPDNDAYPIKRNYSRVFQCALLCTFRGTKLLVTDLCKWMAASGTDALTVDEYLSLCSQRFSFPFPAFSDFDNKASRQFPIPAIIKLLIARQRNGREAALSVEDIFFYLIGAGCTGAEDLSFYESMTPNLIPYNDDQGRQMRELLLFVSQFSFLQFYNSTLYLEPLSDSTVNELMSAALSPLDVALPPGKSDALLALSKVDAAPRLSNYGAGAIAQEDIEFIEGERRRIEHLKIERSSLLRRYYMYEHESPLCCACGVDMSEKYPWTKYLLEIHHLLPLSSSVRLNAKGTSLDDVVGLCPTCHRAIHDYYRRWLDNNRLRDFRSKEEAKAVFEEAVRAIR